MADADSLAADRTLLKLAATAAGYELNAARQAEREANYPEQIGLWIPSESTCWNAFEQGDAALRLAVALNFTVQVHGPSHPVFRDATVVLFDAGGRRRLVQRHEGRPDHATRRAIVLAAATVARVAAGMPVIEAQSLASGAGLSPIETVRYWADAFARDPERVAGGMIVKLLNEYADLVDPRPEPNQPPGSPAGSATPPLETEQ